jgi:hypothetical protein
MEGFYMSANIIRLQPDEERALLERYVAGSQQDNYGDPWSPCELCGSTRFRRVPSGFISFNVWPPRSAHTPHRLAHILPRGTLSIFQGFFDAAQVLPPADSESHQYPI